MRGERETEGLGAEPQADLSEGNRHGDPAPDKQDRQGGERSRLQALTEDAHGGPQSRVRHALCRVL